MPKNTFDWRFVEDEEWRPVADSEPRRPSRSRAGRWVLRLVGMLLVLVLSTTGFYLWLKYEDGMAGIRRDVEHAASLERSAWDAADRVTFAATLDPEADPGWKGHMRRMFDHGRRWGIQSVLSQEARVAELDVHGNTAVAQIEIPALIPGGSAYREMRFYRYSGDQWLRTSPDPDLWGRIEEETSTDHFRFVYHPRDRLPVQETADDIEAFYTRITADLGAGDVIDDPLLIEVRPRTDLLTYRFTGGRLAVPSPGLTPAPADASPSVALKQAIARAIVHQVMAGGSIEGSLDSAGLAFADGIRHWEGWDWAGGIPPWNEAGQLAELREAHAQGDLVPLDEITAAWLARRNRHVAHAQAILLADYVAETYGRESFGRILKAWPEHEGWVKIAPQVLGVSFAEFEAGWLDHLDGVLEPVEPAD